MVNFTTTKTAATYNEMAQAMRDIAASSKYEQLGTDGIARAVARAGKSLYGLWNPFERNARIKRTNTTPCMPSRQNVETMLKAPHQHEGELRKTSRGLTASSYPYYKLTKLYSDILTYRWYVKPLHIGREESRSGAFKRERRLVDKICKALNPSYTCRQISASTLPDGKGFYHIYVDVDKAHNSVKEAHIARLPSDYCMIVGNNSASGYTVAFNLMWFMTPGTSPSQYPELFDSYDEPFRRSLNKTPHGWKLNISAANKISEEYEGITPVFFKNGRECFWVTLPVDKVFTFGYDLSNPWTAPMFMGLFLSNIDMSNYELIQEQLVQNPLYAILTGEIEYLDDKTGVVSADRTKMSPTMHDYWHALFYDMMNDSNTGGIDIYSAPLKNITLQQLQEVPNGGQVSMQGYQYAMTKAGLGGLIPLTDKPLAGSVNTSQRIEARFSDAYYSQYANMVNVMLKGLNLNYEWEFVMFGDIFGDEKTLKEINQSMTMGILPDTYIYAALRGRTIEDELSMSTEIYESGLLDMRIPLATSYTQQGNNAKPDSGGGRPALDIEDITNEETEAAKDKGGRLETIG